MKIEERSLVDLPGETLAYNFLRCVLAAREFGLKRDYICLLNSRGVLPVPVHEVFKDGFSSEGVYYGFVPFMALDEALAKKLKERDEKVFVISKQHEKGDV